MNKALVTGASGFIGSHVARIFASHQWEVFAAARPDSRSPECCTRTFAGDFNLSYFQSVLSEIHPDVIIHCAGCSSVPGSIRDPYQDYLAGPALTVALLEAIRLTHPAARLVFVSSAAVYGNPHNLPISESFVPAPVSPYGFHKLQAEQLCLEYARIFQVETVVARVFSAYGIGLERQVIWDLCRSVALDLPLRLQGTGAESRDFIHASDVADALFLLATTPGLSGETFNVSSGRETTIRELGAMALKACGSSRTVEFDGLVPPGTPLNWRADISRLAALGFSPQVDLETGVTDICRHITSLA